MQACLRPEVNLSLASCNSSSGCSALALCSGSLPAGWISSRCAWQRWPRQTLLHKTSQKTQKPLNQLLSLQPVSNRKVTVIVCKLKAGLTRCVSDLSLESLKWTNFPGKLGLRPNVHTIHPEFYVILVACFSILFMAYRVDSMHIGTQDRTTNESL